MSTIDTPHYTLDNVNTWIQAGFDSSGGSGGPIGALERNSPTGEIQFHTIEAYSDSQAGHLVYALHMQHSLPPTIELSAFHWAYLGPNQLLGCTVLFDTTSLWVLVSYIQTPNTPYWYLTVELTSYSL